MTDVHKRIKRLSDAKRSRKASRDFVKGIDVRPHIADCYQELHEDIKAGRHTYYNLPGGRGSCKSSFASLEIVDGITKDETGESNAIVFRLVGGTMRESVFSQIQWAIDTLGVGHLWEGKVSPMSYTFKPTGAQILFRGLDDALKLKSIKPKKGRFAYIWFEEFCELPGANFVRSVMQSIMRGGDDFTVFRTFNPPISQNAWANRFIQQPDEKAITLFTDYTMIPREWLGEAFLYEAERLREINPDAYLHEYMGQPVGTGGEVFPNVTVQEITDEDIEQMGYIYQGLDFGFAVDPACFIRVAYDSRHDTVLLLDEIYKRHLSNAQMAEEIKSKKYDDLLVTADCAEPKSIADMRDNGILCRACHKEPGCVQYRVKWLQHRRIIIDPKRTPKACEEFLNYSYAIDKDGEVLSVLPDENNHSIDAVAYALNNLIYKRGISG